MSDTDVTSSSIPTTLKDIPINLIVKSQASLRDVNKKSEDYLALVDSISKSGVLNPVVVREVKDATTGVVTYGLVDGLHRFTAALDAGLQTIPANVRNMSDADILEAQIITNIHKIETRPAEYTKQLIRILASNPLMTSRELASKLSKSDAWLTQRLSLGKLDPKIQELVNGGQIGLSNAYVLAKLPVEEQTNYIDRAMTDSPQVFTPAIKDRLQELRKANSAGKTAEPAQFQPVAHLRKVSEIKEAMVNPNIAAAIISLEACTTDVESFQAALRYALNLDQASVAAQKAADEQRKAKQEEAKAVAKAEREAKKMADAAKTAVDISKL